MNFTLGKKMNMTQHFMESGEVIPVTVVKATPMTVTQVKTKAGKDGYEAVQVGVGKSIGGSKRLSKAVKGHLKETKNVSKIAEFRVDDASGYSLGHKFPSRRQAFFVFKA
jgi:large subunit ribosomal protein L3